MSSAPYTALRLAISAEPATGTRGITLFRQVREALIAIALQHLAVLAALGSDVRRGAQLLGCVDAQYAELGMQREPTEQWGYDKLMAALRETLSEDEIATLGAEGAAWVRRSGRRGSTESLASRRS